MRFKTCLAIFCGILFFNAFSVGYAQQRSFMLDSIVYHPEKYFGKVNSRVTALNEKIDKKTDRLISVFQKQEQKIYRRLLKKDTIAALHFLQRSRATEAEFQQQLINPGSFSRYMPYLDTLKTSLKFLQTNPSLSNESMVNLTMNKLQDLESSLQKTELVSHYLRNRKQELSEQCKPPSNPSLWFYSWLVASEKNFYGQD